MRHHILGDKGVEEGDEQMKDLTLGPPLVTLGPPLEVSSPGTENPMQQ